jgi:hypothetical protein
VKRLVCILGGALAFASPAMGAARPYDFNGDGRQKLAVGVPAWHEQDVQDAGAAMVLRASRKSGLRASAQLLTRGRNGFPGSPTPFENLGREVMSGDFNGDSRADLAMLRSGAGRGMVVVYGSAHGLVPASAVSYGAAPGTTYTNAVSADVNHDGFADVAVRRSGATNDVAIFRGSAAGLHGAADNTLALHPDVMRFSDLNRDGFPELVYSTFQEIGVCAGTPGGPAGCNSLPAVQGATDIATGDVTGGRGREVVTGVPFDPAGGTVYVYRYRHGELRFVLKFNQSTRGVPGHTQNDEFGAEVEVLRVGRDRKETIAVGAPRENDFDGRVTLVRGAKHGISHRGNRAISLDTRGIPGNNHGEPQFGRTLTTLDHDGDGRFDLDIGAPFEGAGHVVALRNSRHGLRRKARNIGLPDLGFSPDKQLTFGAVLGRR